MDAENKVPDDETLKSFLKNDFLDDFMEIYGLNLSISDIHPEQANNEARNAFVHLCRAVYKDDCDHHSELKKAKDHLERGKRDCLKLSIIHKVTHLRSDIYSIEVLEGIPLRKYKIGLRKLGKKRKLAYKSETRGEEVTSDLEEILFDLLEMEAELHEKYTKPGSTLTRTRIFLLKTWGKIKGWIAGVLLSLVSAYIFATMFPDNDVSKQTKKMYNKVQEMISPP